MSDLHDLDAERAILASLMIDNSVIGTVSEIIATDDFFDPLLGRVFGAIVEEHSVGNSVNAITLRGYFRNDPLMLESGGLTFLAQLTVDQTVIDPAGVAVRLADLALRRRLMAVIQAGVEACFDPEASLAEIADYVRRGILAARQSRAKKI